MQNSSTNKQKTVLRYAFISTLPVLAGYLVLGIGFGMILKSKGFHALLAPLMSLTIYAGSMQFAAISLLNEGATYVTVALTTLFVNARHLFYGISLIDRYRGAGAKKPYLIFALTDETYSIVVLPHKGIAEQDRHRFYFFVSLFDQIYWVTGSTLGALIGSFLRINTTGMDFALTALFAVIFTDQWRNAPTHAPALIGVGVSALCLLVFGADRFLIPAMAGILICLLLLPRRKGVRHE